MNDIRRTLLWVVFSMSLVLLWDGWNKHNGEPSLFGPNPASNVAAPPGAPVPTGATTPAGALPPPSAITAQGAAAAASPVALPGAPVAGAPAAELVTITTDVFAFSFDTHGGDPVKVELLKEVDPLDHSRNVVIFDRSAQRVYLAQTGLIGAPGSAPLPTHLTGMKWVPGRREMTAGSDSLQVRFESPEVGGATARQDLHLQARQLHRGCEARGRERVGRARSRRRSTCNSCATAIAPAGESSFYFTFTGPAVYDEAAKFNKIDFKSIEKRAPGEKPDHPTAADNGWVAMVQHYFASAWLYARQAAARVLHPQGRHQPVRRRHARAARHDRRGGEQDLRHDAVRRPAGREQAQRPRARARTG